MTLDKASIQNVSDTSLWVAYYRALETDRPDSLFQDPLAKVLIGDRGRAISESMKATSRYTRWSVTIRTAVIDQFIHSLVRDGVDTVLNLGAGMDTRPYRLKLPSSLRWIEVDYPHVIEHKEKQLSQETPHVQLERVKMDLADRAHRLSFFQEMNSQSRKVLVLTEGVIPYLSPDQVATLAEDLKAQNHFQLWITEYIHFDVYRYLQTREQKKKMKKAPFQFFPPDWFEFFKKNGWSPIETRYIAEESLKLNRKVPMPWWAYLFIPFMSAERAKKQRQMMGYSIMVPNK